MIENFQARYLVHNVIDPMLLWRRFDGDMTKRNRVSTASEDCRYLFDKSYVREAANRHFQDLDVVGVTSEVDSFLARVASRFQFLDAAPAVSKANAAPPDDPGVTVDDRSLEIMNSLTEIDRDLYERAAVLSRTLETHQR